LKQVPWPKIYSINVISNVALYILPVRLGEFVRPTYSANQTNLNIGQTASTSVIERAIDGIIIGSLALVALISSRSTSGHEDILRSAVLLILIVCLLLAVLLLAVRYSESIRQIISQTIGRISARLSEILGSFIFEFTKATNEFLSIGTLSQYLGLSIAIWLVDTISLYALFEILDAKFPFQATFMALSLIVLGSFLPSGPGQLGVFEYSVALGLAIFGMQIEDGILVGALYHGILLGTVSLMALSGLVLSRRDSSNPE
jgi:uncharacterized protein (TIRG00374 family)